MPIPKHLRDAITDNPPPPPPEDKLNIIRDLAHAARITEFEIADLEQQLSEQKAFLRSLYESKIPEMMTAIGIDKIGVPARGNLPAFDLVIATEYRANIVASWDEERRRVALDWLERNGHGDLIKTSLTADFPRESLEEARRCADEISSVYGVLPTVKETVNPQTMKSWFKEMWTKRRPLPPLEVLGASVVRVAKPRERKE